MENLEMNNNKLLLLLCFITCTANSMDRVQIPSDSEDSSSEEEDKDLLGELLRLTGGVDQKKKDTLLEEEFLKSFSRCSVQTVDSTRKSSIDLRRSTNPDFESQYIAREKEQAAAALSGTKKSSSVKRGASDSYGESVRKKSNTSFLPALLEKPNVQGIIRKKPDDERDETEEPDYKKRRNK
jgi:hypothetical protein